MLISFRGPKKAGKTTASYHLVSKFNFHRHAFADGVKIEVFDALLSHYKNEKDKLIVADREFDLLSLPVPELETGVELDKIKWCNIHKDELRPLFQWWGTDYRRKEDMDYWLKKWRDIVVPKLEKGIDVVADDCRFWNERYLISELRGIDVYIFRPDLEPDEHESEAMNSKPDQHTNIIIQNVLDEQFLQWQAEGIYYFNKYPMTMMSTLNGTKPNA